MSNTRVVVNLGWTRNMGNFNSMRVDIGVEDDLRQDEDLEQGFNRVYDYIEKKLLEKVDETEKEIKALSDGE
jgi:hypothetical protein